MYQPTQSTAMSQNGCDMSTGPSPENTDFTACQSPFTPMRNHGPYSGPPFNSGQHLNVPTPLPVASPGCKTPDSTGTKRSFDQMSLSPKMTVEIDSPQSERKRTVQESKVAEGLLACPYWTRFPERYSATNEHEARYQKCSCAKLVGLSRLKQHIYRNHAPSQYYCRRCFTTFSSSQQCNEHSQMSPACSLRACPWPEKISDEQRESIKRKRPGLSDYDGWYLIWNILFPGAALPSTPYRVDVASVPSPQPSSADKNGFVYYDPFEASPDRSHLRPRISKASRALQQVSLGQASIQYPTNFGKDSSPFSLQTLHEANVNGYENENMSPSAFDFHFRNSQ